MCITIQHLTGIDILIYYDSCCSFKEGGKFYMIHLNSKNHKFYFLGMFMRKKQTTTNQIFPSSFSLREWRGSVSTWPRTGTPRVASPAPSAARRTTPGAISCRWDAKDVLCSRRVETDFKGWLYYSILEPESGSVS